MANFNLNDYVQVNERIEKFYEKYPEGTIQTELIKLENSICIFKAYAYRDREDTKPATGHAYEVEGSSYINKTSFIENCETSAVGRALAMLGFEIKKSVASQEEVANARLQQNDLDKPINNTKIEALKRAIANQNIPEEIVKNVLNKFKYERVEDIKAKDYMAIINDFKTLMEV